MAPVRKKDDKTQTVGIAIGIGVAIAVAVGLTRGLKPIATAIATPIPMVIGHYHALLGAPRAHERLFRNCVGPANGVAFFENGMRPIRIS